MVSMTSSSLPGWPLRRAGWLVALTSALVLGAALLSQYVGGLHPCVLCLYQRWPYVATILLGLAAGVIGRRDPRLAGGLLVLAGLAFLTGGGIAAFHVGVEQGWWQGTSSCGSTGGAGPASLADLKAQVLAAPVVRCDDVAWSLLGISMAGYNFLVSLALAAFSLWAGTTSLKERA